MSHEAFEYHFGMHHIAYVVKMGKLNKGTEYERSSLEAIIRNAPAGNIYNAAAQVWIHTFFWHSIGPRGGGEPEGALAREIISRWGSFDKFKVAFQAAAAGNLSSGWTWLVKKADGSVDINNMGEPGTLFTCNERPLLCLDIREHTYYTEYRNMRSRFVADFLDNLVNWNFAEKNFNLPEPPDNPTRDYQYEEIY
jgi:Fe-Mn family superoxide dismutase